MDVNVSFSLTQSRRKDHDLLERMNLLGKKETLPPSLAMRRLLDKHLPKLPKSHKKVLPGNA